MPYHIGEKGSYDCKGFPVVKDSDGTVMGCHATEEAAKKQLAALYINEPNAEKSAGFVPPQEVRSNAKRGLELRAKHGRGGTAIGVARARDLSNGAALSLSTVKRMTSYFARHEVDKKGEGWGVDSAGYIAWLLWGGDAGWAWAKRIVREQDSKEKSTVKDLTTAFFEIVKADKREDGTLMVYGKATDDSLDIDQQICDPVWLDRAMPEWFKSGGNIREQHSSIAAGVAKEYEKKADGHYIHALVVDPTSVKKVDNGVLKGFSIGIKSPRVVRDTKAANGRIIDGQIVEVSLVDRPANPNCQLVLAKSAEGEIGMWKVEELIEKSDEILGTLQSEAPEAKEETVKPEEIVAEAKTIAGDIVKFDQGLYQTARTALAQLIIVEANEMTEGHDERFSLEALLSAIRCLEAWYEGEEREGEVEEPEAEDIELSAKTDEAHKCLECGCGIPQDSHGRADVSTAVIVTPDETPKSAEPTEIVTELEDQELPAADAPIEETPVAEEAPAAEETPAEETPAIEEEKISEGSNLAEEIEAIVEKAIKSATESLKTEIAELASANEAAVSKAVGLESELAVAKSLAVAGGPKRTIKPVDHSTNDLLVKAATYKAKADASTDPDLTKGYKLLAEKYFAEADAITKSN